MPSPFTASFASAASGNAPGNDGPANGRNTGSGDWYVDLSTPELLEQQNLARSLYTSTRLIAVAVGPVHELMARRQPSEDLPQSTQIRGKAASLAQTPLLLPAVPTFRLT